MIRTQIQLTEAQAKKVKKLAMEEGTSIAEEIPLREKGHLPEA
jgi:hypothetical protein